MNFCIQTQNKEDLSHETTSLLKDTPNSEPVLTEGTNGGVASRINNSDTSANTTIPVSIK